MRSSIKILVVDDVEPLAAALADVLDQYDGIDVIGCARDGAEAVDMAGDRKPDLVLMDIRMPVMDGITATRHITGAAAGPRVLIMSAYEDVSLIDEAMEAGAVGYLVKGTLVADTVLAIRAALDRA